MVGQRSIVLLFVSSLVAIAIVVALPVAVTLCPSLLFVVAFVAGLMLLLVGRSAAIGWLVASVLAIAVAFGVTISLGVVSVLWVRARRLWP